MRSYGFFIAFLLIAAPIMVRAQAAIGPGDLVKLAGSTAVYYYGSDEKRYVFPNEKTYFSWYADFSKVKTIDAARLAALPLGGNVTVRPGTRLLKLMTRPEVFAVSRGGVLRHVADETAAAELFGPEWNRSVDDLPDVFFADYRAGTPIAGAADYDQASERAAAPTIGADKGLAAVSSVPAPPTAADRAAFEVEALPLPRADEIVGTKNAAVGAFLFKAASVGTNAVTSLAVHGFIDQNEGGLTVFSPGRDEDKAPPTYVRDRVPRLGLYAEDGTLVAGPADVSSDGRVSFSGFRLEIPSGGAAKVHLRGELAPEVGIGLGPDRLAFDIPDVQRDIAVVGADGAAIPAAGTEPNGGRTPKHVLVVRERGALSVAWRGTSGIAYAGAERTLGTFDIAAEHGGYEIETLSFRFIGRVESVASVGLERGGVRVERPFQGNIATFEQLPFSAERDATTAIRAFAVLKTKDNGWYGERLFAEVSAEDPIRLISRSNGEVFDRSGLAAGTFTLSGTRSNLTVRFSAVSAVSLSEKTPRDPIGRSREENVFAFTIAADPAGPVRLTKLAFALAPDDAGTAGADNDALERWAKVNGDFQDDNGLVNLWRLDGPREEPLGENTFSRVIYSIKRGDARIAEPVASGYASEEQDAGIVTYEFGMDDEIVVPAGGSAAFLLQIDAAELSLLARELSVTLLGGFDFAYTDLEAGAYTPVTGVVVNGLPLVGPTLRVE